jgi:hypothetical protein
MTHPAMSPQRTTQRDSWSKWQLPLLIIFLVLIWSVLFSGTFTRPFEWDDLHLIRHYSFSDLLSAFHGPVDPDGVETPALRPIATLLFHLQSTLLGEHMILQRAFMAILMGGLLWSVGLLLREAGLSFRHIVVVLVLFASSRVFASLVLWISLGSVILAYTFMVLTALFYLHWIKRGSGYLLALTFGFAALAVFTREEAYTLPVALPLLWWLSSPHKVDYRRPIAATLGVAGIVALQYILRAVFISDAPHPTLRIDQLWQAFQSAWMPGGSDYVGRHDHLFSFMWTGFLFFLAAVFIRFSDKRRLELVVGICVLGLVLCTPALAIARAFGIALPSLAFFTAISVAVADVQDSLSSGRYGHALWRPAIFAACLIGLAVGVTAGVRRSVYVAEALDENAAGMVIVNGEFLYDMYPKPVTIPESRRRAILAHLNSLGIRSREDVVRLSDSVNMARRPMTQPLKLKPPMFLEKYDYLSF